LIGRAPIDASIHLGGRTSTHAGASQCDPSTVQAQDSVVEAPGRGERYLHNEVGLLALPAGGSRRPQGSNAWDASDSAEEANPILPVRGLLTEIALGVDVEGR
jgi:hypothetical protein